MIDFGLLSRGRGAARLRSKGACSIVLGDAGKVGRRVPAFAIRISALDRRCRVFNRSSVRLGGGDVCSLSGATKTFCVGGNCVGVIPAFRCSLCGPIFFLLCCSNRGSVSASGGGLGLGLCFGGDVRDDGGSVSSFVDLRVPKRVCCGFRSGNVGSSSLVSMCLGSRAISKRRRVRYGVTLGSFVLPWGVKFFVIVIHWGLTGSGRL